MTDEAASGLDVAAGLAALGGSEEVYRKLLTLFQRKNLHVRERMEAAISQGDLASAMRLAHSLRGVAGNIRARALSAAAAELEKCLTEGRVEVANRLMPRLSVELTTVLTRISDIIGGDAPATHADHARQVPSAVDREALQRASALLVEAIESDISAVRTPLDLLKEVIGDTDETRGIEAAIDEFDCDGALREIEALRDRHGWSATVDDAERG